MSRENLVLDSLSETLCVDVSLGYRFGHWASRRRSSRDPGAYVYYRFFKMDSRHEPILDVIKSHLFED